MRSTVRAAGGLLIFVAGSGLGAGAAFAVAPRLPVPHVQAPAPPSLPAIPSVPSAPRVGLPVPVPKTPVPVSAPAPAPVSLPTPRAVSGASAPVPSASVGPTVSAVGAGVATQLRAPARSDRAAHRAAARRRAHERSFRHDVRRHASCFYALSAFQRRVLALRAGVRGTHPHSRAYVARRLDVSARSVGRSERRGLRSLRRANRANGCAGASRPTPPGEISVAAVARAAVQLVTGPPSEVADTGEVAAVSASSDDVAGSGSGTTYDATRPASFAPSAGALDGENAGRGGTLIAALCLLAALSMAAARARSQRRRAAGWSGGEDGIDPAPWSRRPPR